MVLTTEVFQSVLTNKELGTSVETKDLVIELLSHIFGFGECFHAGVVDDNVHFED